MPETSSTKRASQNNWNTERTNSIPEIPTTPRNTFFAKLRDVLEAEFKEVASLPVSGTRLAHSLGAPGGFEQIGRRVVALAAAYTALQQGIEPARLELDANLDLLCGQLLKITEPASPKPQFETATETDAFSQQNAAIRHIAGLTERQREIMGLVLEGHPSKNIAADLGISQRTVENHRACMMKRTGAKSLPALARMAFIASGSTGHATSQMAPKLYPADAVEEDAEVSEEQVQGLKARSRG